MLIFINKSIFMKISKRQFEEEYIKNEKEIEELYDPDGDFGGDMPELFVVAQITTDTPKSFDDESDFETDIPQTTDDFATITKNKSNIFPMYNMGYPYKGASGGGFVAEGEIDEVAKEKMVKMIKELLSKRNSDREFVDTANTSDINNNNIKDINELDATVVAKTNEFVNAINNSDMSDEEFIVVMRHVFTELNGKLSYRVKNEIKRMFNA